MTNFLTLVVFSVMLISCSAQREREEVVQSQSMNENAVKDSYKLNLSMDECTIDLRYRTSYSEKIDSVKKVRVIHANGIPNHSVGTFPNAGNPNKIQEQSATYTIPLHPQMNKQKTAGEGVRFGILFSGVELDPFSNEFFRGENGMNRMWNITPLTTSTDLGLDCNNAHVQPGGKYHYHGTPTGMIDHVHSDSLKMIKLGYAADGFPIYYKYGYNDSGDIVEMSSGFQLKKGDRPGDGVSAPNGKYDGMYFQDYEFVKDVSPLDECNGRWGKTPENNNEYYYVITDNFPSSPLCFSAKPSDDFRLGRPGENVGPQGQGDHHQPPGGGHPSPAQLIEQMDRNSDGKLAKNEVRGPLSNDFDRIDKNGDGFLTIEEIATGAPKRRP